MIKEEVCLFCYNSILIMNGGTASEIKEIN